MSPGTARTREVAIEVGEHRAGKVAVFILLARRRSFHRPSQVDETDVGVRLYPIRIHEEGDVRHARILHRRTSGSDRSATRPGAGKLHRGTEREPDARD